jgi:hypothetical protein
MVLFDIDIDDVIWYWCWCCYMQVGTSAFGAYVISMTTSASDVLAVRLLQKEAGMVHVHVCWCMHVTCRRAWGMFAAVGSKSHACTCTYVLEVCLLLVWYVSLYMSKIYRFSFVVDMQFRDTHTHTRGAKKHTWDAPWFETKQDSASLAFMQCLDRYAVTAGVKEHMRVVPLFETKQDLENAPACMNLLFNNSWYKANLSSPPQVCKML